MYDHDHTAPTYALACWLADRFAQVTLLTPRTEIAKGVNYCSALGIHRRLHQAGVHIVVAAEPQSLRGADLRWRNVFSGKESTIPEVDLVVYVTPRQVDDSLAQDLEAALPDGVGLHRIGDSLSPRKLLIAIHEGHGLAARL